MDSSENEFGTGQVGNLVAGPYKVSWVGYVIPTLGWGALALVGSYVLPHFRWGGLGIIAVALAAWIYRVLYLRSVRLFADSQGIWLSQGILPWHMSLSGVKWRDLDSAVYYSNFIGWAAKSYNMRISHRFTQGSEILPHQIRNGHLAVREINTHHENLIRRGEIDA